MPQKNKALIFLNGDEKDLSYAKKYMDKQTLLIGCDGGADSLLGLGLKPDAVIGDFDSIKSLPKEIKNLAENLYGEKIIAGGITYIKYPGDKDFLDAELAINFAVHKKIKEITLVNTNGDELDHVLGTIIVLARNKYRQLNVKAVSSRHKVYIVSGKAVIRGSKGDKISLIPLYGPVNVESSAGLKYDPAKYKMSLGHNIGISNELTDKKAALHINSGRFLVVQHY